MEGRDSSDVSDDGLGDDNNKEVIIIPITKKIPSTEEGHSTENGVTVINFDKSKHVVCDQCSLSLKSMKYLEIHMKVQHNYSSYNCSECGISKFGIMN